MANPKLHITNGPGQRDLELAFIGRNLDAHATFTIFVASENEMRPLVVRLRIYNFEFVTCHGPNYKIGGHLRIEDGDRKRLPPFNFIFVSYNADWKNGTMEFSNGG